MGLTDTGASAGYGAGDGAGAGAGDDYGYGDGAGAGAGHGYGDGYSYGAGAGAGAGDGYGYGYGDGAGHGYGDGYSYGAGAGYGDGDGYGYGDGDGAGYGYGAGDGAYFAAILESAPGAMARQAQGCILGFWRSDEHGQPVNGGHGTVAHVGLVEEVHGPLEICTGRALHGTMSPYRWKGCRLWIVALYPPVQREEDKMGSLKREFLAEIPNFLV